MEHAELPVEEAMEETTDATGADTVMGVAASLLPRSTQTDEDEAEQLHAVEQTVQGLMDPGLAELAAEGNMSASVLQQLILRELASSQVRGCRVHRRGALPVHAQRHVGCTWSSSLVATRCAARALDDEATLRVVRCNPWKVFLVGLVGLLGRRDVRASEAECMDAVGRGVSCKRSWRPWR
jgi:hypothetical protein